MIIPYNFSLEEHLKFENVSPELEAKILKLVEENLALSKEVESLERSLEENDFEYEYNELQYVIEKIVDYCESNECEITNHIKTICDY